MIVISLRQTIPLEFETVMRVLQLNKRRLPKNGCRGTFERLGRVAHRLAAHDLQGAGQLAESVEGGGGYNL